MNKNLNKAVGYVGVGVMVAFLSVASVGYPNKEGSEAYLKKTKFEPIEYLGHSYFKHGEQWKALDTTDGDTLNIIVRTGLYSNPEWHYVDWTSNVADDFYRAIRGLTDYNVFGGIEDQPPHTPPKLDQ